MTDTTDITSSTNGTDPRASDDAFDLHTTFVHLGLGATATPLPDFDWSPPVMEAYQRRLEVDGDEGRLVGMFHQDADWTSWEQHPAGEEVVILLSGRADMLQYVDGEQRRVTLQPGHAVINPPGVWHTADVHEPGDIMTITPGRGTDHISRDAFPPGA